MNHSPPLYSVITVVRNGAAVIRETIESVIGQDCQSVEYIVIDGASSDNTLELASEYRERLSALISEPDRGVYDGMNKGIRLARGKWLNFMNAGDRFLHSTMLSSLAGLMDETKCVVYGQHESPRGLQYPRSLRGAAVRGPLACHQAMFFNREQCAAELYYDLDYAVAADWDLTLRLLRAHPHGFQYLALPICFYDAGGLSTGFRAGKLLERFRLLRRHGGVGRMLQGLAWKCVDETAKLFK